MGLYARRGMEGGAVSEQQEYADRFYHTNGPCCAGCDWWDRFNSVAGECTRSAPVSNKERGAMIGASGSSAPDGAGHIITKREHHCGEFKDDFDWQSLPLAYLKRINYAPPT